MAGNYPSKYALQISDLYASAKSTKNTYTDGLEPLPSYIGWQLVNIFLFLNIIALITSLGWFIYG